MAAARLLQVENLSVDYTLENRLTDFALAKLPILARHAFDAVKDSVTAAAFQLADDI